MTYPCLVGHRGLLGVISPFRVDNRTGRITICAGIHCRNARTMAALQSCTQKPGMFLGFTILRLAGRSSVMCLRLAGRQSGGDAASRRWSWSSCRQQGCAVVRWPLAALRRLPGYAPPIKPPALSGRRWLETDQLARRIAKRRPCLQVIPAVGVMTHAAWRSGWPRFRTGSRRAVGPIREGGQ